MTKVDDGRTETLDIRLILEAGEPGGAAAVVAPILAAIESQAAVLMPETFLGDRRYAYHRAAVLEKIPKLLNGGVLAFSLVRTHPFEVGYEFYILDHPDDIGGWLSIIMPFGEALSAGQHTEEVVCELVAAIAEATALRYGYGHPRGDLELSRDPVVEDPFAKPEIREVHWLNVYGPDMVKELGAERVRAVPRRAFRELNNGTVVFTACSLGDVLLESGRRAQSHALVHICGKGDEEELFESLQRRGKMLEQNDREWDPSLAPLYELLLERVATSERSRETDRLNRYHPPEVAEYVDASAALPTDVDEPEVVVNQLREEHAEQVIALLSKDVPEVLRPSPESLSKVDLYFFDQDFPAKHLRADIEKLLVQSVGAYLGELMVNHLGARWVPRHVLDESQVILGSRAWLPFRRAQHYLRNKQSALDYSLTQFYQAARRQKELEEREAL